MFEERSTGRRLAYYNDCKRLTPEAVALARGADVVVLDGLRPNPHPSHMCIEEACAAAVEIGTLAAYLTHLTHHVDHAEWSAKLPSGVHLAYDGLKLHL